LATWRQVAAAIAQLPETKEETDKRGHRNWIAGKNSFAWERPLRASDLKALGAAAPGGPILAVRTADLEMKDALLGSGQPGLFTTPHFNGYAAILIALDDVGLSTLKTALVESWLARAPAAVADAYLAKRRRTIKPQGTGKRK
jgi:hypothetical protein